MAESGAAADAESSAAATGDGAGAGDALGAGAGDALGAGARDALGAGARDALGAGARDALGAGAGDPPGAVSGGSAGDPGTLAGAGASAPERPAGAIALRLSSLDRVVLGLAVALLLAAVVVPPVWRALDPTLAVSHAFFTGAPVDPWGNAWVAVGHDASLHEDGAVRLGQLERPGWRARYAWASCGPNGRYESPSLHSPRAPPPEDPLGARIWYQPYVGLAGDDVLVSSYDGRVVLGDRLLTLAVLLGLGWLALGFVDLFARVPARSPRTRTEVARVFVLAGPLAAAYCAAAEAVLARWPDFARALGAHLAVPVRLAVHGSLVTLAFLLALGWRLSRPAEGAAADAGEAPPGAPS